MTRTNSTNFHWYLRYTVILSSFAFIFYLGLEPQVGQSAADQFIVTQVVTEELSIKTPAADVAMSPSLPGITGGTSNGNTNIVVLTNNYTGYNMTIAASNSPAMRGNLTGSTAIADYTPATNGTPDYAWSNNAQEFGYTVSAASTSDIAQKFLDNASACNTGSADTGGSTSCWYNLSTVATSVVNRTVITPITGATTTLYFRVYLAANSFVPEDTYTATSTLTITMN